jgi:hypothetical protein
MLSDYFPSIYGYDGQSTPSCIYCSVSQTLILQQRQELGDLGDFCSGEQGISFHLLIVFG